MLDNYILLYVWQTFTTFLNMFFTVSGSGIVNPISTVLTDPYRAIGIGYTIFLFGSIHRVYLFRKNIFEEKKNIVYLKIMIPASILGAVLGGVLLSRLNLKLITGLIIVSSIYFIYKTIQSLNNNANEKVLEKVSLGAVPVAVFSGFLQGASLPGVDIRNNFLRSYISEVSVRAVSSTIGLFNFLVVSLVLLFSNKLLKTDLIFIATFIPMLLLAQTVGRHILVKLQDKTAKIIALTMSVVSLFILIFSFLK